MERKPLGGTVPRSTLAAWELVRFSFLFLCLFAPLSASAQTPAEKLERFGESAGGYELMRRPLTGTLQGGADRTFSIPGRAGVDYMVAGFCGEGCENLDLVVLDSVGGEVGSDRLPDAQPTLAFRGESDQPLWLKVAVVSCSRESCPFAVGVFWNPDRANRWGGETGASRLQLFRTRLGELGYTALGEEIRGSLGHEQEARIPIPLKAGNEYRIGSICDNDCLDLDLVLQAPEGDTVESDFLRDAFPVLVHVPTTDGDYTLTVRMALCFLEPCGFRAAAMSRAQGVGPGGVEVEGNIISEAVRRGQLGLGDERFPEGGLYDAYSIPVEEGQSLIVDVRSEDFDPFLAVQTPSGEKRTSDPSDTEAGHSHIDWVAPEGGSYRIVVTCVDPNQSGGYFLHLAVAEREAGATSDTAAAEAPVRSVTERGRLDSEDEQLPEGTYFDTYTLEALDGQTVTVDLVSEAFDPYLILVAPDGTRSANDDLPLDPSRCSTRFQASQDGTYTILVTSFSAGSVGDYILQFGVFDGH
jgi:hypothetical protein